MICPLLMQSILFCGLLAKYGSPVHFGKSVVNLRLFLNFTGICTYPFLYEEVRIDEVSDDSMPHFALLLVNK